MAMREENLSLELKQCNGFTSNVTLYAVSLLFLCLSLSSFPNCIHMYIFYVKLYCTRKCLNIHQPLYLGYRYLKEFYN